MLSETEGETQLVNSLVFFGKAIDVDTMHWHANKCLSTLTLLPYQALTQLQAEIDNAKQLVKSSSEHNAIDLETSRNGSQRLETALRSLTTSERHAGSPVVVAAFKLISDLDVRA